jgi:hypothetical protein
LEQVIILVTTGSLEFLVYFLGFGKLVLDETESVFKFVTFFDLEVQKLSGFVLVAAVVVGEVIGFFLAGLECGDKVGDLLFEILDVDL